MDRARLWVRLAISLLAFFSPGLRAVLACGGGVVGSNLAATPVVADRQRIFLSLHADTTDVVTEVAVPDTTGDYGVLVPVTGMPVLDPNPVSSRDLDALDAATLPQVFESPPDCDDGLSCGCPVGGGADNTSAGPNLAGVDASAPVEIGPVTAVVLTADTGEALAGWLAANGFSLPAEGPALIDSYVGPGRHFIAIRRNEKAPAGGPTHLGIHFTLPGDARVLPLRFARLGAAPRVSFTVIVAAPTLVGAAAPFTTLSLLDLDKTIVRKSGYATAVEAAVASHANQAFVIESTNSYSDFTRGLWSRLALAKLIEPDYYLTRLTTTLPPEALSADVALDQPFKGRAPTYLYVQAARPRWRPEGQGAPFLGTTFLLGCALLRRRGRR